MSHDQAGQLGEIWEIILWIDSPERLSTVVKTSV
jgi:hypothetical protein